jgi:predicted RNase H-like nuclease (RuvC/YqgF family)
MTKQELQQENAQLKTKIQEMVRRIKRLKARVNDLRKLADFGRRGIPWR